MKIDNISAWLRIVLTLGIGVLGVVLFKVLHLPLPFLMGPIFTCLVLAVVGFPLKVIKPVNDAMRTILGVAVGATFTTAVLHSMLGMWATLLLIPVMVFAIGCVGVPYFRYFCRYDFATSYYACMPGGLQDMLAFGEEAGANVRALSLIQATRVLGIVVLLPLLLQHYWNVSLDKPPGAPAADIPAVQLLIMVLCALFGWFAAKKVGLFGASILGPMIVAGVASLSGVLLHRPPSEAIWVAQFFIGMTVGVKYVGITVAEIRRDILAGLGFCLILIALTLLVLEFIHLLNLAPPQDALLAFSPGGQAELTVLALIVGADVAFVVAHHVVRLISVILGAPIMMQVLKMMNNNKSAR